ncbi:MAG: hypothetical protein EBR82_43725 [Caulobacteraceae bacterium]|nr:hypothetical protein [Caulobacteraceae bacterium]
MFTLADRTGWPIDYILWEVPLCLLYQGSFVSLWMRGVKMRRAGGIFESKEKKEIAKLLGLTK